MPRKHCSQARFLVLLVIALTALAGRARAQATATLTVSGSEQQISGTWDSGNITAAFDNFSETIHYGQFSTPAAIASALAGLFSRDFIGRGLCAHASGAIVTFQLKAGSFGALRLTGPTTSFQLSGSGFGASSVYDSGTVTLTVTVNGQNETAASTTYGQNSSPVSVAAGLAANIASGSPVTVEAVNDAVYLQSSTPGSATDYQFTLQVTSNDPSVFTTPSFESTSGQLEGAADASSNSGTPIYSYGLSYQPNGDVGGVVDSVMGTWVFSYDTLDRLTGGQQTTLPTDSHAPPVPFANYCWSYDGFGNRTAAIGSATVFSQGSACTSTPFTYNTNNHVNGGPSVPSYDPSGNVNTDNSGDGNVYLYDAEGRVCAVLSGTVDGINIMTGYVYDADGRRVAKGTITNWSCDPSTNGLNASLNETDYVLDQGGHQVTEMANDASGAMTWAHTNVWAGGQLLGTYDATTDSTGQQDGALHFYLSDWLGSRRAQADYAGVWEQDCSSLPYGDQLNCTQSTTQPTEHHFTGKERDSESGNDYFGARYYASTMGRFLSPDWSAKEEPVPYAKLDNPQTLNLYQYMGNNPLGGVDPDGHCCWDEVVDFMSGASGAYTSDATAGLVPRDTPSGGFGQAGAAFGDTVALAQGVGEMLEGGATALGGGTEALVTSPAAETGVGALIPAAGVGVAVAGAAVAVHGAATAGTAADNIFAMGKGSYTNTHASGRTYSGKGDQARSQASGRRVEQATGDKHVATDHTSSPTDRESFKDESRRIDENGGVGSNNNYNKIESPGKKYRQQGGSN